MSSGAGDQSVATLPCSSFTPQNCALPVSAAYSTSITPTPEVVQRPDTECLYQPSSIGSTTRVFCVSTAVVAIPNTDCAAP